MEKTYVKREKGRKVFSIKELDASIHPADDFFAFVNGKWDKKTEIPPDKSRWGSFDALREDSAHALRSILTNLARKTDRALGAEERKLRDLYLSGMNEKRRNAEGYKDLVCYIERIASAERSDLPACIAELEKIGVDPFFSLRVDYDDKNINTQVVRLHQGGTTLPDRDYYLEDNARFARARKEFLRYMERVFMLIGEGRKTARARARMVMRIETNIARHMLPREKTRDPKKNYRKMRVSILARMHGPFQWDVLFAALRKKSITEVVVDQVSFVRYIGKKIVRLPIADARTYLLWHLLDAYAGALSAPFRDESFRFHGKVIAGAKKPRPLWKQIVGMIDGYIGDAIGKLYVEKHFPKNARAHMREMVRNIRAAFQERISALAWMDSATRKGALRKLETLVVKIGFPSRWKNYRRLCIDPAYYAANVIRLNRFVFEREIRKVGKKPDKTEWHMSPATVNAYYSPNFNEIVFPAAILQPPFFNPSRDAALNYGGIGSVIGHEISHAFDDSGSEFDHLGNMKNWWSKHAKKQFSARTKTLVRQYDAYEPLPGQKINGKLTLGENIADLCGVIVGFRAYQKYLQGKKRAATRGFSPEQRYFMGYALTEREKARPEYRAMQLKTDPHSPSEFRVNGVVKNMDEFLRAFAAQKHHALFLEERARARVW